MFNEQTIIGGSKWQEECKESDYAKMHEHLVKFCVPWLVVPDLCLWMHAIGNPLSPCEKTHVWEEYMSKHGNIAKVTGVNLLIRAVGMELDQSLHVDSRKRNLFAIQSLTEQYKICVLPGGNHIDWSGRTHLPTTGEGTQECVAEENVLALRLNQGDIFLSFDCTPHAGGSSSGTVVDKGDHEHLCELLEQQSMNDWHPGTSDVAFQTHIQLAYETLSYGGNMKCSYTKTYDQLERVKGSLDIQKKTNQAIERHKEKSISFMRHQQLKQFEIIKDFYKELKKCKKEKQQVECKGILTSRSCIVTIASAGLKRASIIPKGTEGRERKVSK